MEYKKRNTLEWRKLDKYFLYQQEKNIVMYLDYQQF